MPRLWRFLHAHPEIDARVAATMKVVDFAADGVDVAIRMSNGKHPDLHVENLFDDSMLPVCAPRLVEQGLRSAADLARFPLIHHDIPMSMRAPPQWSDWLAMVGMHGIDASRGLRVNVADHALDAAVAGAGVSLSFKLIASDDVHSGRLVSPFGPELPLAIGYHFVCPKGHETQAEGARLPRLAVCRDGGDARRSGRRAPSAERRKRRHFGKELPCRRKEQGIRPVDARSWPR